MSQKMRDDEFSEVFHKWCNPPEEEAKRNTIGRHRYQEPGTRTQREPSAQDYIMKVTPECRSLTHDQRQEKRGRFHNNHDPGNSRKRKSLFENNSTLDSLTQDQRQEKRGRFHNNNHDPGNSRKRKSPFENNSTKTRRARKISSTSSPLSDSTTGREGPLRPTKLFTSERHHDSPSDVALAQRDETRNYQRRGTRRSGSEREVQERPNDQQRKTLSSTYRYLDDRSCDTTGNGPTDFRDREMDETRNYQRRGTRRSSSEREVQKRPNDQHRKTLSSTYRYLDDRPDDHIGNGPMVVGDREASPPSRRHVRRHCDRSTRRNHGPDRYQVFRTKSVWRDGTRSTESVSSADAGTECAVMQGYGNEDWIDNDECTHTNSRQLFRGRTETTYPSPYDEEASSPWKRRYEQKGAQDQPSARRSTPGAAERTYSGPYNDEERYFPGKRPRGRYDNTEEQNNIDYGGNFARRIHRRYEQEDFDSDREPSPPRSFRAAGTKTTGLYDNHQDEEEGTWSQQRTPDRTGLFDIDDESGKVAQRSDGERTTNTSSYGEAEEILYDKEERQEDRYARNSAGTPPTCDRVEESNNQDTEDNGGTFKTREFDPRDGVVESSNHPRTGFAEKPDSGIPRDCVDPSLDPGNGDEDDISFSTQERGTKTTGLYDTHDSTTEEKKSVAWERRGNIGLCARGAQGELTSLHTQDDVSSFLNDSLTLEERKSLCEKLLYSQRPNVRATTLPDLGELPHTIFDVKDRLSIIKLMTDKRFSGYLDEKLRNICLFFERPREKCMGKANLLTSLGKCSIDRWDYVSEIHCIFPSRLQLYAVRRADIPHYQELFLRFLLALSKFTEANCDIDPKFKVIIYDRNNDYSNDFLLVKNNGVRELLEGQVPDWDAVAKCIRMSDKEEEDLVTQTSDGEETTDPMGKTKLKKKKRAHKKSQKTKFEVVQKRQKEKKYYGYTANECTTRDGSTSGEAGPRMKPGTREHKPIRDTLLALTHASNVLNPEWLEPGTLYVDPRYPNRQMEWANKLAEGNRIEGVNVFQNIYGDVSGCHGDDKNPKEPTLSTVLGLSSLNEDETVRNGSVSYMRESITSCLRRDALATPMVKLIGDTYAAVDEDRQKPTTAIRNRVDTHSYNTLFPAVVRNPCNMDPQVFHQPYLHFTLLMVDRYNLSFAETIGVQTVMEFFHPTALFFIQGVKAVLSGIPAEGLSLRDGERGFAVGYLLLHVVNHFFHELKGDIETKGKTKNLPEYRRYNGYFTPKVPSINEWNERCYRKTKTCLGAWSCYPTLGSRLQKDDAYALVFDNLECDAPDAKHLAINHSMGVLGELGILPPWFSHHALVSEKSKSVLYFGQSFYGNDLKGKKLKKVIECARRSLGKRFKGTFTVRKIENIMCKVYRFECDCATDKWRDLLDADQNLFRFDGKTVEISCHSETSWRKLPDSCLIPRWPWGDELITPQDMVTRLAMGKVMPTDRTMKFPDEFWDPRVKMSLPYDFSRRNVMTETGARAVGSVVNRIRGNLRKQRRLNTHNDPPLVKGSGRTGRSRDYGV